MAKDFALRGVIEFLGIDKAVQDIKKLDTSVTDMKTHTSRISDGASQAGKGLTKISIASAGVDAGFAMAIKQAADFEQAMANINSVNELTQSQFNALRQEALHLGSSTVFSAKEAADGMFELTKAGLSVDQTLQAIPGVLAAAATEGMQLGQASEIVVGILQGQNMQMDQATRVADVLAKTASSTASGILDLGEAFKYANQLAASSGMSFEDTAASLGILSNAGLKGSIAGTSMVAMFKQITTPSKDVQKAFGGMANLTKTFTDEAGRMKSLPEIIDIIGKAADQQSNDFMKMAFLSDFVGVEGAKAFNAIRNSINAKDTKGRPMFQGLREDLQNASGAAEEMAKKRLNTLNGTFTMLHHEVSSAAISLGNLFIPELRSGANEAVAFMRNVAQTFIAFSKAKEELTAHDRDLMNSPLGQFIQGFIEGIKEGIAVIKQLGGVLGEMLKNFGIGQANEDTGRLIGKFLVLFGLLAPMIGGFLLMTTVISSLANTFMGLGNMAIGLGKAFLTGSSIAISALRMMGGAAIWLVTNPIGWIILGITAVVAIGWFMYKNWGNIWGATKKLFTDGVDWIVGSFQYLINWFKTASIGEIIVKTLLLPIRLALTPIMELIQALTNSDWVKNIIGKDTANMLTKVASTLSLLPDTEDIAKMRIGNANAQANQTVPKVAETSTAMPPVREIAAQSIEAVKPVQTQTATDAQKTIVVQSPAANVQIENVVKLDGKELSRSMAKQQVENSERAGMNAVNPKNRQLLNNGQFAPGFSR